MVMVIQDAKVLAPGSPGAPWENAAAAAAAILQSRKSAMVTL